MPGSLRCRRLSVLSSALRLVALVRSLSPRCLLLRMAGWPAGWEWAAGPVDTGCTNSLYPSSVGFSRLRASQTSIRSADGSLSPASLEGMANIAVFDVAGRPSLLAMPGSLVAPTMAHLLSVNDLRAAGVGCYWPPVQGAPPFLVMPGGGRVKLRLGSDKLWYLDYLRAASGPVSAAYIGAPPRGKPPDPRGAVTAPGVLVAPQVPHMASAS